MHHKTKRAHTNLGRSLALATVGLKLFTVSLLITFFMAENVVWIIGLNGTCLFILLVFVEPLWILLWSRLKQSPLAYRSLEQLSASANMLQATEMGEKGRVVKWLKAFSVVPLLTPKPHFWFWGDSL